MTVLWMDGFDHYVDAADAEKKWTASRSNNNGATSSTSPRRTGSRYINLADPSYYLTKTIENTVSGPITIGSGIKYDDTDWVGMGVVSGDYTQIYCYGDENGTLYVKRGDDFNPGTIGIAENALTFNQWQYLEFRCYIHDTAGYFDVYVDGINVLSSGSINTQGAGASNLIDGVCIWGDCWYDDLYVTDGDILGDSRIDPLLPTASGTYYNTWTGVTSSNHHLNVDDPISATGPDDDATYNASDIVGSIDTYRYTTPALSGDIHAAQLCLLTRRDQPGIRWAGAVYREDGTDYAGSSGQLFDAYDFDSITLWNAPPSGLSAQWTEDYINYSGEFGIKVIR